MKKLVLSILFFGCIYTSNAEVIIKRLIMSDDCNGNYSSTTNDYPGSDGNTYRVIQCECSETCGICPSAVASGGSNGDLDANDIIAAGNLFGQSDAAVINNINSGTATLNVQVSGESFTRHYTVTWALNGSNVMEMILDRTDY